MGRKIYITSDMSYDEKLIEVAEINSEAALLWPWILTIMDDWGRAEANAKRIKAKVFPCISSVTPETISDALKLYNDNGLLILYEVNDKQYIAIPHDKWFKYQTHIRKEKRTDDAGSQYPAPPNEDEIQCAQMRESEIQCAQMREDEIQCIPSPSPSPSPSKVVSKDTTKDAVPTAKELIGDLTKHYQEVIGAKNRTDYPFIGGLYNKYSYSTVLEAIDSLKLRLLIEQIDDPRAYLAGILRNNDKPIYSKAAPEQIGKSPPSNTELYPYQYINSG